MEDAPYDRAIVVDDDPDIALTAQLALGELFKEVVALSAPNQLAAALRKQLPDVILLDLNFRRGKTDGSEGLEALKQILKVDPEAAVVVITAHGGVTIAVEAIKRGATDFVSKPWLTERLEATVRSAAALRQSRRNARLEQERSLEVARAPHETVLLGRSPALTQIRSLIARAAPTDANVLIVGENGTGKELVAREIHRLSKRAARPIVSIDLGSFSESLFDSELFGHVKGAFTDAKGDRIGRLKAADGSTLFLDEIGNLPVSLQPKLLSALEQREVTPVGSNQKLPIDVRVVAATNRTTEWLANETHFRQDLLFRLNTIEIVLAPLRERRDDIPMLLDHYLEVHAKRYGKPRLPVSPEAMDEIVSYSWPGNIRALRHAAERATILAEGTMLRPQDFALPSEPALGPQFNDMAEDQFNLELNERQLIERALRRYHFNISLVAEQLGLSRAALYRRMIKYGL